MTPRIYLDHAATTPLAAEVREAMLSWLDAGNASSLYAEGRRAKDAIDAAREAVSEALGCAFGEVVFTSSGTEAANLAILGTAAANTDPRRSRILLGAAEHHCVLHTRPLLERLGYRVELVPVDRYARIDLDRLGALLSDDVLLLSAMHANNELGTLNDPQAISTQARNVGAFVHVDAVQTFRALPWRVDDLGADLVSVSAHKIHGPKGAGALYVRGGVKPMAMAVGGGQEREMRAGTENVAAVAGFGAAVRLVRGDPKPIRDAFELAIADFTAPTVPTGVARLPGHAHFRIPGLRAETLLILLDRMGVAASSGAACSSGAVEPSHVLLAAGFSAEEAKEGVRFSFGSRTTLLEGKEAAERLRTAVTKIRGH
ncbi:MAG: cysteine desulfurase family protein [Fimbriimonas sp.]